MIINRNETSNLIVPAFSRVGYECQKRRTDGGSLLSAPIVTMSEQEVPSTAQCIIIKFIATKGVKPAGNPDELTVEIKEETLARARVFTWFKKLVGNCENVLNVSHICQPHTCITN